LKYDVLNNNIRNVEGFPRGDGPKLVANRLKEKMHEYVAKYYPTSVNGSTYGYANGLPYRGFDENGNMTTFIQDENGFTKYDVRPSGMQTAGSGVAGSATSVSTSGPSLNDNPLVAGINNIASTAADYLGYKWADQLDLSDTTFTGKLSNMMQIFNGIANNALESILTGKEYESVFGYYNGSNGGFAQNDGNIVTGSSHIPRYILVKNGRIKGAEAYLDVGDLDLNDDSVLTSIAEDVVREFYPQYKEYMEGKQTPDGKTLTAKPPYDENPEVWKSDVESYKTQIKDIVRNNQYVDGRYYHLSDPDSNETIIMPAWLDKDEIIRRMKTEYPLKSYKANHPDMENADNSYDAMINDWYRTSIEGMRPNGSAHPVQFYDGSGMPITQNDVIHGNAIKLPNGSRVIVPSALKGSYASDDASSTMTWEVKVPNDNPIEIANTMLPKSNVNNDYTPDPGVAFDGDTARSKLSNQYGIVSIPTGYPQGVRDPYDVDNPDPTYVRGAVVPPITTDLFTRKTPNQTLDIQSLHTLFRDVRKFPPINSEKMNQLIDSLAPSDSPFRGMGQDFVDASNMSGLDPRFLLVQSGIESAWGKSYLATNRGNLFGIGHDGLGAAERSLKFLNPDGSISYRKSLLMGSEWISRNHMNSTKYTIPNAAPALMGWNSGHTYGDPADYGKTGFTWRTGYGNTIAATLHKTEGYGEAEGYGDPYANPSFDTGSMEKDIMGDKTLNRILGNFDKIDTSAENEGDFSEGFGNISSVNTRDDHSSSNMNINASRSYSPRANITTNDNSRSEIDVNVDLNKLENGTASMIKLLEKIVLNTSKMRNSSTVINNNNYESVGYGNATTKGSEKVQNVTIVNNENSKINNNHTDKMRLIHERIAKSPRNYL
jgi:hypothetical protein